MLLRVNARVIAKLTVAHQKGGLPILAAAGVKSSPRTNTKNIVIYRTAAKTVQHRHKPP